MDSLYNFYLKLIPDLLKDLVFYVPNNEIINASIAEVSELNYTLLVNSLFIFDEYQGPMPYSQKTGFKHILSQSSNLEKNIFKLVQKRKDCTDKEFKFLLDKYLTFVKALTYCCKWLYDNLNTEYRKHKIIESEFYLQLEGLTKHQETLLATFHLSNESQIETKLKNKTQAKNLISDITSNLSELENNKAAFTKVDDKNIVVDSISNTSKSNKKVLITEAEAEKNLLKTFFGIG